MLKEGLKYEKTYRVEAKDTALSVGSGDMMVLATPTLIAHLENAAMVVIAEELDTEYSSVGGYVELKHLSPTFCGMTFKVCAEIVAVDGKKVDFKLLATDDNGIIAEGVHTRFIVNREKFTERAKNIKG